MTYSQCSRYTVPYPSPSTTKCTYHSLVIVRVQVSFVSNGKLYQTDCWYRVYVKILQLRCYTIFFFFFFHRTLNDIILPSWKQINCCTRRLSITNIRASARCIYLKILTNSKYNANLRIEKPTGCNRWLSTNLRF